MQSHCRREMVRPQTFAADGFGFGLLQGRKPQAASGTVKLVPVVSRQCTADCLVKRLVNSHSIGFQAFSTISMSTLIAILPAAALMPATS